MISRRQLIVSAAAGASAIAAPGFARAQGSAFPNKPIRIVVPYAAGGTNDVLSRSLQEPLQRYLGQPIVVENRLGASGTMGTQNVSRSAPDGYSLISVGNSTVTSPLLIKGAGYDSQKDLVPVALIATTPMVFLLNPVIPATNIAQLIEWGKSHQGALEFASAGRGSLGHLATESFNQAAGLQMVYVPYQGAAQAVNAVLAGDVKVALTTPSDAINAFVASGRVRMIAVSSPTRSKLLPNVPAISETLPKFGVLAWFGLSAPAGTPPDVVAKLNDAVNKAIAEPAYQTKLTALGMTSRVGPPAYLGDYFKNDQEMWTGVIQKAKLEPE